MNFGLSLPTLPVIKHAFTEKTVADPKVSGNEDLDDDSNQRDSASSVSEDDENDRGVSIKSGPIRYEILCFQDCKRPRGSVITFYG